MRPIRINKSKAFWVIPVAVVILCVLLLQYLFLRRQVDVREVSPKNGVLDITAVDCTQEVLNIQNNWDYYPNELYTSEDFSSGKVIEKAGEAVSASDAAYGTYRLLIRAKPNQYYTICGFSIDYATRVFANGSEIATFGKVADHAADSVPQVGYMTLPLFSGESGEIEVIYQYSNYVHREGGFIQPTYLSSPQNMEEFKAGNNLASLSVSGGLLLLTVYFLLNAVVRKKSDFLCLALCCLVMALRDQNFYNIHLLPPDISWYVKYRIFILVVMLLPVAFLLLLKSVYYKATKNWPLYVYLGIVLTAAVLIIVLPTQAVALVSAALYYASIPYLCYLLAGVVRHYWKQRRLDLADVLTLAGFLILLGVLLYEALLTGKSSAVAHYGVASIGMLGFVFLTAISISFRIQAQEIAFVESRNRSRMLERMNQMNMDFLHKVAHELKTPLTVISGYAQLTGMQLAANHLSEEMPENLKTIQQEAQRLANMVTQLLEYSYGRKSEIAFSRIHVREFLDNVGAIAVPMCLKNKNEVVIDCSDCPDIHGNFEMLLQVFINLIVNANKHTENGRITLSAFPLDNENKVQFQVLDTGTGISEEYLVHIFEQGFSADGSSGLGLSICQEAVEAHGGKIWVEKTDENGTIFAFTILEEEESC